MSRSRAALAAVLALLVVAGCGVVSTSPPAPTPADFQGIAAELTKRGIVIDDLVSGDAGCSDATLIPTAIGLTATGLDQDDPVRVRLFIFRNRGSFDRLRATVEPCARTSATDPDALVIIERSPFVVTGQGPWGAAFEAAVRDAIVTAAGTGD